MTWVHGYKLGEIARLDAAVRITAPVGMTERIHEHLGRRDPLVELNDRLFATGNPTPTFVSIEATNYFTIVAAVPEPQHAAVIADIITRCDLKILPQDVLWTRAGDIFIRESPSFHENPIFLLNRWLFLGQVPRLMLGHEQTAELFRIMGWPLNGIPRDGSERGEHRNIMLDDDDDETEPAEDVIARPRSTVSPEMRDVDAPTINEARGVSPMEAAARTRDDAARRQAMSQMMQNQQISSRSAVTGLGFDYGYEQRRMVAEVPDAAAEQGRMRYELAQAQSGPMPVLPLGGYAQRRTRTPQEVENFIRQHHTPQFEHQLSRALGRDATSQEARDLLTAILADEGRDMSVSPLARITQLADVAERPTGPIGQAVRGLLRGGAFQELVASRPARDDGGSVGNALQGSVRLEAGPNVRIEPAGMRGIDPTDVRAVDMSMVQLRDQLGAIMNHLGIVVPPYGSNRGGDGFSRQGPIGVPGVTGPVGVSGPVGVIGNEGPRGPRGGDPEPQIGRDVG